MWRWAVIACASCGFQHGELPGAPGDAIGDGRMADAAVDVPLPPWGTPTYVGVGGAGADDPTLTEDRLELYYNANSDIYVATRAAITDAWSTGTLVAQLSSAGVETTPEVSYDGLTLGFARDGELYVSTRASRQASWGVPVLVAALNSAASEAGPVMSPDGLDMVFTSTRKTNVDPDIYETRRASTSSAWGAPVEQTLLDTSMHEGSAFLTADKLSIYFDSDRAGSPLDLYYSHRASPTDPFPAAQPLTEINTASDEEDPWLSPDGRYLVFYSDRGGMAGLWEVAR